MGQMDRGIYQPAADDDRVVDVTDDDEDEERSRLPLLIVIGLLILAAFAGVVWLAYNQGLDRGRQDAPRVIAAPEGPVRVAPEDPGGVETPFTGLKIYNEPVPPDSEAESSNLAAPAETPMGETGETQTSTSALVEAVPVETPEATPPAAATPEPETVRLTPPPAETAAVPTPSTTAAAASGAAVLQIGAYESEEIAEAAWRRFRTRHADFAANLDRDIQRADLGDKGVWYRVRVGPYGERGAAVEACETLKSAGGNCFVVKP